MCLPLFAVVQSVEGSTATIKLLEGQVTTVNTTLTPGVKAGENVLVDRGMSIEIVSQDRVEEMIRFYKELTDMWAIEDEVHV